MSRRWRTVWVTDSIGDRPGLAGHLDKVVRLRLAGPDVVVSADDSGTIVARRSDDGSLIAPSTRTGTPGIGALAAWLDGANVRAATGAGSAVAGSWLQRWDLGTGHEEEPPIKLDVPQVRHVEHAVVRGEQVLVVVTGTSINAVAIADWPAVYIARIDGTVSLVNLESGAELCPPLQLPTAAGGIAVVSGRGLIVSFGSDVARLQPPA